MSSDNTEIIMPGTAYTYSIPQAARQYRWSTKEDRSSIFDWRVVNKYVIVQIKYSFTVLLNYLYRDVLICPGQFQNKARNYV